MDTRTSQSSASEGTKRSTKLYGWAFVFALFAAGIVPNEDLPGWLVASLVILSGLTAAWFAWWAWAVADDENHTG